MRKVIGGALVATIGQSSSIPVKQYCITKLELIGDGATNGSSVVLNAMGETRVEFFDFDWSQGIVADFNSQSVPVLQRSCFSEETNELNSFRIVMRGSDPANNILSNSAGPSEYGNCSNKRAPVEEAP